MHSEHPTREAGYCGDCHQVVRLGETCCEYGVGWIAPDGLAWSSYREYLVSVGGGRMADARRTGSVDVLALDADAFMAAVREADASDLIRRAIEEDWPDWRLRAALDRLG